MVTGKVPFDADTPVSVALKHMQETPEEPKKLNSTIPESVNKIIIKAMQKDPNLRYSSATEMLVDLREAVKNPNGNFVVMNRAGIDEPTRIIRTDGEEESKKENKKQSIFKKKWAKVLLIILICLLVFGGAMFATLNMLNGNRPKEVQIPSLVGLNIDEAKAKLDELNLKYEVTEEFSPEGKEEGLVLSQEPKYQDNYKINETEVIKLVVSKGIEMVEIPKVAGDTKEEAIEKLEAVNLKYEITEETNDKIEEGIVIKQEPAAGEEIAKDSTVKIFVSLGRGIKEVTVPYVIGKTEKEARKMLEDAGLTVETVRYETDTTKPNGQVLKQGIEADKVVDEKTPVSLTVNKLEEIKTGTLNINLKSLLRYQKEYDEEGKEVPAESVEVEVRVTSNGSEDTVYKKSHKEDTEKISVPIEGVGTVTVKVFIDGVRERQENMDLSSGSAVLNID